MDESLIRIGYWPCWADNQKDWAQKISPRKIVEQLVEGKIKVLEWGVPERIYLDDYGSLRPPHPAFKETKRDILAEASEEARRAGIKITFGIPISRYCINDPAPRAEFMDYCREFTKRYDMDGVMFDGPTIHSFSPRTSPNALECAHCQTKYRNDVGCDMPAEEDWNSPNWKKYVRWCGKTVNEFLKEARENIKGINPDINISVNSLVRVFGGWATKGDTDTFHECVDNILIELFLSGNIALNPNLHIKLSRALTEGRRPEGYLKTSNLSLDKTHLVHSRPSYVESATLAYLILANGAVLGFHSSMDDQGEPHPERTAVYLQLGKEIDRLSEWLIDTRPAPEVAVLYSQNTRNFYGGADQLTVDYSFLGTEQMLAEAHIDTEFVLDHQLDEEHLKNVRVLVMPNAACLTRDQADAVRAYVENGGALLATGETSLYDEDGNLREEFALSDVFGVSYKGVHPKVEEAQKNKRLRRYPFTLCAHEITEKLEPANITRLPWFDIEVREDREPLATWCDVREDTCWACVNGGLEIAGDSGMPLIVVGEYGKGKVCYISANITSNYVIENAANIRKLTASIIRWMTPLQVEINAPKCVFCSVGAQGERRIIHLVNCVATSKLSMELGGLFGYFKLASPGIRNNFFSSDDARKTPRPDIPDKELAQLVEDWRHPDHLMPQNPIDEVVPVYDVTIKVRGEIGKAYLAPEKEALKVEQQDGCSIITVPRIDIYAMVVVE